DRRHPAPQRQGAARGPGEPLPPRGTRTRRDGLPDQLRTAGGGGHLSSLPVLRTESMAPLTPGTEVVFRPGSVPFELGGRSGAVVGAEEPRDDFLDAYETLGVPLPLVRVNPCRAFPQGVLLPFDPAEVEVVEELAG